MEPPSALVTSVMESAAVGILEVECDNGGEGVPRKTKEASPPPSICEFFLVHLATMAGRELWLIASEKVVCPLGKMAGGSSSL